MTGTTSKPSAGELADREKISQVFDGWLERYENGPPIEYTPAREYAADAVKDCRDLVLSLISPEQPRSEGRR